MIGEALPALGVPLYADARLYRECGIPTVPEANAKQDDENLLLEDLRRATKVVALTLLDFLAEA